RQKRLNLDVALTGAGTGDITFTAEACRPEGTVERTFTATTQAAKELSLSFAWPDPRLWDEGKPELYLLRLSARGAGIDDVYVQEFGFREFWIEGKRLVLNGSDFRLRPAFIDCNYGVTEAVAGSVAGLRRVGFNFAEMWPWDRNERGTLCWDE